MSKTKSKHHGWKLCIGLLWLIDEVGGDPGLLAGTTSHNLHVIEWW